MRFQNTLKNEVVLSGIGLHTGRVINMKLKPAPRDTGISFIRTDIHGMEIKAGVDYVSDTAFATTLSLDGAKIGTVEHLLAALAGLNIDNLYVELDGPEVPIMDGSALYFTRRIMTDSSIVRQAKEVPCIRILKPLVITEGTRQIAILPYDGMRISCSVYYNHPTFREQRFSVDITAENFIKEIAPARTFGFLEDVKTLRSRGLAKGGSLSNAIVVGEKGVLNKSALRFKNEFVRHKILDILGDFSLLRKKVSGHIIAHRTGHSLNIKLVRKILSFHDTWEMVPVAPLKKEPARELTVQV